ncbi:hypothetical protein KORDIASMS9_04231 [Kordia sp. SMS9]|uniref:hypothetical protein n=1 Tax=Kordia sp. SMS9 TaxID=2282170 RepID=UPI000E0D7E4A|nr:hypothetical protein [Kordia sp. SMS9]AXG71973.1 hypothetical protein KORDIASMS9_04231 [Kordia sp. SMS9]
MVTILEVVPEEGAASDTGLPKVSVIKYPSIADCPTAFPSKKVALAAFPNQDVILAVMPSGKTMVKP